MEVADQQDPEFYLEYSVLSTDTLRIIIPARVPYMRVNTPCILGAPKLPRAIMTLSNHPVRSTLWNTNFSNLFHSPNLSCLLGPWMCFWLCVYMHTCTSHSFRQILRLSNMKLMTNLFVNGIPSGVEPNIATNLLVQRGLSWIPCLWPRKSSSWEKLSTELTESKHEWCWKIRWVKEKLRFEPEALARHACKLWAYARSKQADFSTHTQETRR